MWSKIVVDPSGVVPCEPCAACTTVICRGKRSRVKINRLAISESQEDSHRPHYDLFGWFRAGTRKYRNSCIALFISSANPVPRCLLSRPSCSFLLRLRFGEIIPRIGRATMISARSKSKIPHFCFPDCTTNSSEPGLYERHVGHVPLIKTLSIWK